MTALPYAALRRSGRAAARLALAAAVLSVATGAAAETALERAERADDLLKVPADDPAMDEAMKRAQATLAEFLALVREPPRFASAFSVKIPLPVPGGGIEYVWIQPVEVRPDGRVSGAIANRVVEAKGYREGQTLTVDASEIADWTYRRGGRRLGHFTTCVLMDREPDGARFRAKYGIACEN